LECVQPFLILILGLRHSGEMVAQLDEVCMLSATGDDGDGERSYDPYSQAQQTSRHGYRCSFI
jgi:hypothetical protein